MEESPKHKRLLIIIGVVVIISAVLIGVFYFSRFKTNNAIETSDLFFPMTEQVAIMLRTSSMDHLKTILTDLSKQDLYSGLLFVNVKSSLSNLDSLTERFPQIRSRIFNHPILISWQLQGDANLRMLAVTHFPTLKEKDFSERFIQSKLGVSVRKIYNNTAIYHINIGRELYISFWEHYCLIGESQLIVEQSLLKLHSGESISSDSTFSRLLHSAGESVDANIFFNFANLQKAINKKTTVSALANQIYKWGTWGGYDVSFSDKGISLRGFSTYTDKHLLQLFKGQEVQDMPMLRFLPANVDCFLGFPISDYTKYLYVYKDRLDRIGGKNEYNMRTSVFKKSLSLSPTAFIKKHFSGEVGYVLLDRTVGNIDDDKVLVMSIKSGDQINNLFEQCMTKSKGGLLSNVVLDQDVKYNAYQLGNLDVFGSLFGSLFNMKPNSYYVIYNNYLLCSSNKAKLREFIYRNTLKRTFDLCNAYELQKENLTQKSNLYLFARTAKSRQFLSDLFMSDFGENVAKMNNLSGIFSGISATIDLNNQMAYTSVFANYQQKGMQDAQTVWESRLDDKMYFKPHFVTNHLTGEREILIQDVNNVLYLINNVGRVLWKKPLSGPIVGDVAQVDYFRNGKLQMWFATPDALHLMDRNGNYVDRYPVKFPSKATNGLAVFDYAGNRNYRGFIACEDHRVYAYSLDGNRVSGWNFGKTERTVSTPVQWIHNDDKDYLVFADEYRTYILDRKGNERVKLKDLTPKGAQSQFYLDQEGDNTCFLTTTPKGEILRIYMDGKVLLSKFGQFTPHHFFEYGDINGDGRKDFIFADNNKLFVFNSKGKTLLKATTPSNISYPPVIYTFGLNSLEIGIVNQKEGLIRLYDKDGKMHNGFPLQGQTMFSIGQLSSGNRKYSLVVGGNNNYLYNYSID